MRYAIAEKNRRLLLNLANSLGHMDRPTNWDADPSVYRVKPTLDIQPNRFDVSYGNPQVVEAVIRRSLGNVDARVQGPGGTGTVVLPMTEPPGGERYDDIQGTYFHRVRAVIPARIGGTRDLRAGDNVNVTILAGGQDQRFSYRVASTQADPTKKRVLVVAAEDYTGTSPNVTPDYDTAPRYLQQHVDSLTAAGYEVATFSTLIGTRHSFPFQFRYSRPRRTSARR